MNLRRALNGKLWFVHEQKFNEMLAFLELKLSGGSSAAETVAAIREANEIAATRARSGSAAGGKGVAVISMYGLIMHRPSMDISGPGGCSTLGLSRKLREAMDDPNVGTIIFDVDSPGGSVDGVDELAAQIFEARKKKKIIAISDCLCASAAYYLAAQATEFVVSPSSLTGSIGVYCMHEDDSEMLAKLGVKLTYIKYGENKTEGNSAEPLGDSAREHLQEMVDSAGVMFEKAVARGRRISADEVHKKFGQGRLFDAKQAVKLGLADRVGTLDEVLAEYGVGSAGNSNARADACEGSSQLQANEDGDHSVCTCACASCVAGDCSGCSCEGCDSEGCSAESCGCDQGSADASKKARATRERRLKLAGI
jgi:signal peptide peptidase SppA